MNKRMVTYTLGWVLNIEAVCLMLPLICAVVYREYSILKCIGITIVLCLFFGILAVIKAPKSKTMYAKEGFVTVALSWVLLSLFGSLPFYLSGTVKSFAEAFFEIVSGFTTTGASILCDLDVVPRSLLFWRSFSHWVGGMGVLVFLVALLPLSGGSNLYLIKAESTGPSVSKIVPKVHMTARVFYGIYIAFTVSEVVLLLIGGLGIYESLVLSFGSVGTGGFAILNSGIAGYSPYVQIVITVFMFLCGVDFSLYYLILTRRFKDALTSEEFRAYTAISFTSIALITINCLSLFDSVGDAIRNCAFQVVSIMTTTGYSTVDFNLWPEFSKAILVVLMFIGGCAGSTAGGIKVSRIIIMLKSIGREIKTAAHPKTAAKIRMNGRLVEHETVRTVNVYVGILAVIFTICLIIISIDGMDFTTNFTAVAATINNIGPGLGIVGPSGNFSGYSDLSKIVLSIAMLVGRLEIFPMLLLFYPKTWKK